MDPSTSLPRRNDDRRSHRTPERTHRCDLTQLRRMTDDTGLFQHCVFATPDANHGYCIDDNARALIVAVRHAALFGHDEAEISIHRYLGFLHHARNPETGAFRNFMGFDRRWLESVGSNDSQGRTVWALGEAVRLAPDTNTLRLAEGLYHHAIDASEALDSLRAQAFTILGADAFLRRMAGHGPSVAAIERFGRHLHRRLRAHRRGGWPWWEDEVSYDNARLPQALLVAAGRLEDAAMAADALASLDWLWTVQEGETPGGSPCVSIIGNDGWLCRDGTRARFDQQPLEAAALVDACLDAARVADGADAGEDAARWRERATLASGWFHGVNDLGVCLVDPETHACRDGLHPGGVNQNQGAESVLALLMSELDLAADAAQRIPGGTA
ncbi:hypothetical protein [Phycisphaera mikurensis]|uniref:Glycosyltransferase n=1 Tax=Phycisphaera mikurensis (strain NBRC 102666 / KCTC 22515 / FYK2301M01) TaxID=1142394 RepID=I0IBI2_PHYMF|nr:hypothetical protein [Phycisphaera mikurensis]MBB6442849.1 hypothetical protein [Phycisphaera mikurensis]BAM02620.1 hypothetical protein PSMK_04610 [Phycisphaera mikurensis NBRC 102666]